MRRPLACPRVDIFPSAHCTITGFRHHFEAAETRSTFRPVPALPSTYFGEAPESCRALPIETHPPRSFHSTFADSAAESSSSTWLIRASLTARPRGTIASAKVLMRAANRAPLARTFPLQPLDSCATGTRSRGDTLCVNRAGALYEKNMPRAVLGSTLSQPSRLDLEN